MSSLIRRMQRREFKRRGYLRPVKVVDNKTVNAPWPLLYSKDTSEAARRGEE